MLHSDVGCTHMQAARKWPHVEEVREDELEESSEDEADEISGDEVEEPSENEVEEISGDEVSLVVYCKLT